MSPSFFRTIANMKIPITVVVWSVLASLSIDIAAAVEDAMATTTVVPHYFSSQPEDWTTKMLKATGENQFTQIAYQCDACSWEQFDAIDVPEGWSKGPKQVILTEGDSSPPALGEDVPTSVDFVDEISGNEFTLIAKVLDATILSMSPTLMSIAQVARDTTFRYRAGKRVHELTDKDGDTWILFGYEVESRSLEDIPNFQDPSVLSSLNYPYPEGWVYSTRILDEDLVIKTGGVASVLTIKATRQSEWQKQTGTGGSDTAIGGNYTASGTTGEVQLNGVCSSCGLFQLFQLLVLHLFCVLF